MVAATTSYRVRQALFVADAPSGEQISFVILDDDRCAVASGSHLLLVGGGDDATTFDAVLNEFLRQTGKLPLHEAN
jgi:hypothetical protein